LTCRHKFRIQKEWKRFWQVSHNTDWIWSKYIWEGKNGLYAHQLPIYDSQDITKGYQKIIPQAVNKKRKRKYQFMKKIILELGFRIYLLGHLEKQLIKHQKSNLPSKKEQTLWLVANYK